MANALYDTGRNAFLNAGINYLSDNIKMVLVSSSYTPNLSSDQYYSSVNSHIISTPQLLTGKSSSAGVANCSSITFPSVPSDNTVTYLVIYDDSGTPSSSQLIACIDTASGLPISTNGGDIVFAVDTGSNKLFKL